MKRIRRFEDQYSWQNGISLRHNYHLVLRIKILGSTMDQNPTNPACGNRRDARAPPLAAPVTRRADSLVDYLIFAPAGAAKRAIFRLRHPDGCRARVKTVVGGRIDGAAKNRRTLPGLPGARSWVILLADNCAERWGHRRAQSRSST